MCEFLLKCFCCCCSGPHIRNGNASMECDNTANREGERVRDLSKASAIINHFGPFVCLEQMSIEQSAQFCLVCVCGEEYIFFFGEALFRCHINHIIITLHFISFTWTRFRESAGSIVILLQQEYVL